MGNRQSGVSPAVVPRPKHGFFHKLFAKTRLDATALAQTCPPPVGGEMPVGECAMLRDRPALRLDSRLVCKYEILSVIGKGSFSQVMRVQHRISRKYFAVKLVSSDCGSVNNELNILSRVSHPFVIRLEEVFKSSSRLFIVMEMASGGEMYERVVSKGRYSESEARQALKMLLNGLAYLHSLRITHRDLKPENLLYSDVRPDARSKKSTRFSKPETRMKRMEDYMSPKVRGSRADNSAECAFVANVRLLITDFGLAHQATRPNETMTETCGTPEYIAPELLLRVPYTEKVDMWAVGVIAYILMSGIMPFDDDCRSRLYTHIITANYVYYPQFWSGSELAKQFVDCLLETNAAERLSAVDAARHEWMTGERVVPITTIRTSRPGSEYNNIQRTKSTRSIRSVTRSDHGHRVDPREVDQLANDLKRAAQSTKNYGVF